MRQNIRSFVTSAASAFELSGPIFEFGSLQIDGQEAMADLRPIFPNKKYVGCDMAPGKGVDRIENLEGLTIESGTVGTAVCTDTLEHLRRPELAIREIHKSLSPDGVLILTSVMDYPIHNYPMDYWRFTPDAFKFLISPFEAGIVGSQGWGLEPHTVFAIAFKKAPVDLAARYEAFRHRAESSMQTGMAPRGLKGGALKVMKTIFSIGGNLRMKEMLERILVVDELRFEMVSGEI